MFVDSPFARRSMRAVAALAVVTLAACDGAKPTSPAVQAVSGSASVVNVYASGSVPLIAWDPIFPPSAFPVWQSQCTAAPGVGLDANWQNPHAAATFPLHTHPWEDTPPMNFAANWINAWTDANPNYPWSDWRAQLPLSHGPSGQSWTKYSAPVSGDGDFVVQFLADNCSWIYIDNSLVGYQNENWQSLSGRYQVTLHGDHTLTFIIWDGGGLAGGKFRLETRQSFIDNGGDPNTLPPATDNTPPVIASTVTGTLGNNDWYTSDVGISWTVTDNESTVSSTTGCGASTLSADSNGATYTCSATSAGGTASATATVKRDATAPVIAFGGNNGTYTVDQSVDITCSATDAMSGIASSSCPGASGAAYGFGVGTQTLSASATDNAGNGSSASAQFSVQVTSGSLCTLVQRWVSQKGVANSMCQQLANGAYGAFRNHVSAQSGKFVSAAHATILISLSQSL